MVSALLQLIATLSPLRVEAPEWHPAREKGQVREDDYSDEASKNKEWKKPKKWLKNKSVAKENSVVKSDNRFSMFSNNEKSDNEDDVGHNIECELVRKM